MGSDLNNRELKPGDKVICIEKEDRGDDEPDAPSVEIGTICTIDEYNGNPELLSIAEDMQRYCYRKHFRWYDEFVERVKLASDGSAN